MAVLGAHGTALAVRHDVRVTVGGPSERLPLAPEAEAMLYRIGQEAVTNAVKHAHADRVTLTVRDEGVGFDADHAYGGHMGWS